MILLCLSFALLFLSVNDEYSEMILQKVCPQSLRKTGRELAYYVVTKRA